MIAPVDRHSLHAYRKSDPATFQVDIERDAAASFASNYSFCLGGVGLSAAEGA
jgi:hypothetical protein